MAPLGSTIVVGVSALSACLAPIAAAPTPNPFWLPKGDMVPNSFADTNVLNTVSLSLSNGTSTLPSPASGLSLKVFAIGVGYQNYTCANDTAAPETVGAVATLINAADLMPYMPAGDAQTVMNISPSFFYQVGRSIVDNSVLPKAGLHYFAHAKTPTFDMTQSNLGVFFGSSAGDIVAPLNATSGPHGAVDWLAVKQNATAPANDQIKMVYRIFTASGKPAPSCAGQPAEIQIPYSAQYLFYG